MVPRIAAVLFLFGFTLSLIKAGLHAVEGDYVYLGICAVFWGLGITALVKSNILRNIVGKGRSNCSRK